MSEPRWYYFGCKGQAGHYLFEQNGQSANEGILLARKLGSRFDGVLPPQREDDNLYVATFTRLHGLGVSALSWWDRTVDSRPGSNSTVFAPGLDWTPETLMAEAPKRFPWVFTRLPVPLTLVPLSRLLTNDR